MRLFQFILWIIVAFIVAKMLRIMLSWRRIDRNKDETTEIPPGAFDNVQDAEFEDITPKSPPQKPPQEQ